MRKKKNKVEAEHINWFQKFGLLGRLKISFEQQKAIRILRRLKIEGIKKPI